MKLIFKTLISNDLHSTFKAMNQDLFQKLAPPAFPFKIVLYQGEKVGDQFELHLGPPGFKQIWKGQIADRFESDSECYFVDIGLVLPAPLTQWRHKHQLIKDGDNTVLVDDVEFSAGILTGFVAPFLSAMFFMRKPLYKKYLNKQ